MLSENQFEVESELNNCLSDRCNNKIFEEFIYSRVF